MANTLALRLADITRDTPNFSVGVIVRDESGEPTGLLRNRDGFAHKSDPEPGDDDIADAIKAANQHQLMLGITSATDPHTPFALYLPPARGAW
ncbi:MAG: amidohydrolase family protein [Anaerolineae bacterium]